MNELDYIEKYNLKISPKTGLPTKDQKVKFICDSCKKEFTKEWISLYLNYILKNKEPLCKSCMLKERITQYNKSVAGLTPEERFGEEKGKKFRQKMSEATSGENNPRYGVDVTKEQRERMSKAQIGKTYEDKFGKEGAIEMRKKLSKALSGEKNPMYGKPSPQGSGNGWSGWYKGFYFRSILELSFLKVNLNENLKSAEYIKIPYIDYNGVKRNYLPDFILNDKELIEIKPLSLINSLENKLKFEAAKKYCEENNLIFKVFTENDFKVLSIDEIRELKENNEIKFIERYEEKYKQKFN